MSVDLMGHVSGELMPAISQDLVKLCDGFVDLVYSSRVIYS